MTRHRGRPRIKISRITNTASRFFANAQSFPGWTGSHPRKTWATAISTTMSGCSVPMSLDPPRPPPPNIQVILIISSGSQTAQLGTQLAKDLGQRYIHINLHEWLCRIVSHPASDKREVLGLLHISTVKRFLQKKHVLSPRSVADIFLRSINMYTRRGRENFVITGFADTMQIWRFKCVVAEPNAMLVLGSVPKTPKEELMNMFDESKIVPVPVDQDGSLHLAMLQALGEKAGVVREKASVDEEDLDRERVKRNELVAMVANAALRSPENGLPHKDTLMEQEEDSKDDCDIAMDSLETWCST